MVGQGLRSAAGPGAYARLEGVRHACQIGLRERVVSRLSTAAGHGSHLPMSVLLVPSFGAKCRTSQHSTTQWAREQCESGEEVPSWSLRQGSPGPARQPLRPGPRYPTRVPRAVLVRLGPGLLPRSVERQPEVLGHCVRPRSHRAPGVPHARRRRRPTRAGLPRQTGAHPQLRPRQRLPGGGAPEECVPGAAVALRSGPPEVAKPVLRHGHRSRPRGDRGLRLERRHRSRPLG